MTEHEWLSCLNPEIMLAYLIGQGLLVGRKRECWLAAKGDSVPEQRSCVLRDIFGNPWRPAVLSYRCRECGIPCGTPAAGYYCVKCGCDEAFCPWLRWNHGTIPALARTAYEEHAFEEVMPILADALEDAGCANLDILRHCRGDAPHVRGCWVLDLLLGKG